MSGSRRKNHRMRRAGDEGLADVAERLAVLVELGGAFEGVQVADHVEEDEQQPDDAGDRHRILLADVGL